MSKYKKRYWSKNSFNLGSSTRKVGKTVTQILHFESGNVKTYDGILTDTWKEGKFSKVMRTNGHMLSIQGKKLECFETIPEGKIQKKSDQNPSQLDLDNFSKEQILNLLNLLVEKIKNLPN